MRIYTILEITQAMASLPKTVEIGINFTTPCGITFTGTWVDVGEGTLLVWKTEPLTIINN